LVGVETAKQDGMKKRQLETFVEASDIVVPEDMLAEAVERMTEEAFHQERYKYMARGRIFTPEDFAKLSDEIRHTAHMQVKTQLVLEDVIRQEALEVTRDELEDEAKALAERQQMTVAAVKDVLGADLVSLRDDVLIRKAIDFITA
jgi:trigger factor